MKARLFTLLSLIMSLALLLTLVPGEVSPTVAQSQVDSVGAAPSTVQRMPGGLTNAVPHAVTNADAQNVEFVGHVGGYTRAVAVQGGYAYVGEGATLTILDISNTASPTVVGKTLPLPDIVRNVCVADDYAYVAAYWAGLRVLDVSNPANPTEVGFYDAPGRAYDVVVAGDYAYVAADGGGLRVVDVSNPANPTEVGFYYTPGSAIGVAVAGDYVYVADYDAGLRVVNVSNPSNPTEAGFYDTPGYARDVAVAGGYAYVADDSGGGLQVVDVSNPSNPIEVGFYDTPGWAYDVVVAGGYTYVADFWQGLRVVDVSNPANPTEVGFYDPYYMPMEAWGVAVAGSYVYVADNWLGLRVVNISVPSNPTEVGSYYTPGDPLGVAVAGGYAYVADKHVGLRVVEVSMPANPAEVGFYHLPWYAFDVAVAGDYAYVADYDAGLRVVDVSNPANPTQVGFYDTPRYVYGVAVSGGYAYVAAGSSDGLRVVNVSNPANPTEVSFYDTPGSAVGVAVAGGYAYIADGYSGLRVMDVSSPANPTEVSFYDTPGNARDVAVAGGYAYVADYDTGLRVVDVSNPANPTEVGFYDTPGYAEGVAVAEGYAYVADYGGGLFVLRYTGPSISGKVTDGHNHSLPGVFVGLLREGEPSYVATTTTDSEGNYVFNGITVSGTYRVRVILRDGSSRTQIHYGQYGLLTSVETQPFSFPTGPASVIKDIDFGDTSLNSSVPAEHLDDLAVMFYHSQQVNNFVRNTLHGSEFQPVESVWGFSPTPRVFYNPAGRDVNIDVSGSQWNDPNCPMNREWHENFHHVMNDILTWPPYHPCQSGSCETGDCVDGDCNHRGYANHCTVDSWVEGWAEFWPCVLWDTLGYPGPHFYRAHNEWISFEYNWQVWDEGNSQSREEFAVASLLWDLYDPKEPSDSDNVDLSLNALWSVIGQTAPDNDLADVRDVYNALWQATLTNEDGTPVTGIDIDEVFIAHGFYADLNGDHQCDPGEEVGWGGRGYRRNTPVVQNAYIKVNVEDENGNPVQNSLLLVEVHFDNSYYDYSYTVDLSEASGNMVYLELPPTRTVTIAELTAIHGGGRSDPYTTDNSTYWDKVSSSTTGYTEELTFVIHYRVYLPIVFRSLTP